jgi:hypothetical protein
MAQKRAYRPRLEQGLEDRITPVAAAAQSMAAMPLAHAKQLHIEGVLSGTTQEPAHQIPDAGTQVTLRGTGQVTTLGRVGVAGTLHLSGFIAVGRNQGLLTLSGRHGKVFLRLDRTVDNRLQSLPPYSFSIVAGTGDYRGASGTGSAEFEFGGPLQLVPGPGGHNVIRGSFLLALSEPLPPVAIPV